MTEIMNNRVSSFALWIQKNAARLLKEPADIAADQIGRALLNINEKLGVEVAEEIEEGSREAIVTAFSDPSLFSLVHSLVALLQDIPGWRFTALKQPRGFAFKLSIGEYQLNAKTLAFSPIPEISGGVRLVLSPKLLAVLPKGQDVEELAWLIVETGIGEELAGHLKHLEFVSSEEMDHSHPITELANYLTNEYESKSN